MGSKRGRTSDKGSDSDDPGEGSSALPPAPRKRANQTSESEVVDAAAQLPVAVAVPPNSESDDTELASSLVAAVSQNDTESDDSRPKEAIPQKRPRKDGDKGKEQAEPVPSSPKGPEPKKAKKKGYDAAAAAAQAALAPEHSAHLEQANVPTGCPALLCGNTDHWDTGHGDGSGCQLFPCGSVYHNTKEHLKRPDPRMPFMCPHCDPLNTLDHDEDFHSVCGTCGELDHGDIAHAHPCDALVCTGRIWASRSKEELWEMVANGFLSENVLYSWFPLISYEDHVLEHKHSFVSAEEPNGCRPFLVHCGSLGHTRAAHGGVEPLYCSQCGSFEHRAKEHVHYMSACHTSANGCGQRGHSKVTAGACVFNINDLKKLTPKEALDELMGPQSAQRTVVMAFQKFFRYGDRTAREPASPEEELAATLYEVIEDAIGRFTKISFEMSLFMDLFFKYVRDLRLLGGDLRYPHLDMSLGLNAFFAVAAPLDGDEDHADTLVPLLNTFRDTEWLGCVKRAARHGYKRTSRIGLGQIMRTASQGYVTAAMNSVKGNLHDRVRAWTICRIRIRLHKHGRFGPQQPNQGRTLTKGETTAIATHFVNSLKFWDPREHPANTNRPFTLPNNELYDKVTTDPLLLEICRDVYTELRDDLLKGLYLNPYWVAYHWQRFFDVLFRIQREHEELRKKLVQWTENLSKSERKFALRNFPYNHKLVKPFNVLPRFSIEAKHILIDRIALHQLLQVAQRRLGQEPTSLADYLAAEAEDPEHWWRMFFRPEKVNTGGAKNPSRHFDYSFSTNAVQASITVRVRKPSEEQPGTSFSDIKIPGMSVAGLDPGSTAILTVSTGLSTPGDDKHHGHSKAVSVSAGEYYHLARYKNNTWKANQRKKRHPSILEIERDTPVAKASTVADTKLYIHHCLKHLSTIVGFYGTKVHRRSRFDRYIGKHTAQEAVAEKVIEGCGVEAERLILAFGKARFRHNMRGGVTTPGSALAWLKRILRRRGVTVTEDVDEDMTSQICAACWEKVGKQHPKNGHYQIKDCRNPECLIKCWNRDVMAATNIRTIALSEILHGGRPPVFYSTRRANFEGRDPASASVIVN